MIDFRLSFPASLFPIPVRNVSRRSVLSVYLHRRLGGEDEDDDLPAAAGTCHVCGVRESRRVGRLIPVTQKNARLQLLFGDPLFFR